MKLKELKEGEYFTLKPIAEPSEEQVYVRGEYDRLERKYLCQRFDDISYSVYMLSCIHQIFLNGDKEVYTDFTF